MVNNVFCGIFHVARRNLETPSFGAFEISLEDLKDIKTLNVHDWGGIGIGLNKMADFDAKTHLGLLSQCSK